MSGVGEGSGAMAAADETASVWWLLRAIEADPDPALGTSGTAVGAKRLIVVVGLVLVRCSPEDPPVLAESGYYPPHAGGVLD